MDPDTELGLIKHGVTFILLAVPQYTLVGIDAQDERYCQAVKSLEFDRQLRPYNLSQYGDWKHLSNYITKSIVERIGRNYHGLLGM
nr:hypothetical protein CFP56_56321 [Quercus suber]